MTHLCQVIKLSFLFGFYLHLGGTYQLLFTAIIGLVPSTSNLLIYWVPESWLNNRIRHYTKQNEQILRESRNLFRKARAWLSR